MYYINGLTNIPGVIEIGGFVFRGLKSIELLGGRREISSKLVAAGWWLIIFLNRGASSLFPVKYKKKFDLYSKIAGWRLIIFLNHRVGLSSLHAVKYKIPGCWPPCWLNLQVKNNKIKNIDQFIVAYHETETFTLL